MYGGSDAGLGWGVDGLWSEIGIRSKSPVERGKRCTASIANGMPVRKVGELKVRSL
jgi:hypothetical protein